MFTQKVELKDHYCVKGGRLDITCANNPWDDGHENWRRPMVVVVPGGGYHMVSKREGEPVAARFLAMGFQACVLEYLCSGHGVGYPEQLIELSCAVDYIKKHSKELFVNEQEIFVIGFSAGGHLVADLACEYSKVSDKAGFALDAKPRAVGLCYAVINDQYHTFENLLSTYSGEEKERLKEYLKLENRVSADTPPAFIWATAEDKCVPSQNSLKFALALAENGVEYELHVYPKGKHGLSTGSTEINEYDEGLPVISAWVNDMLRFFRSYCQEKF